MEKKKGGFRTSIGGQALIEGILMRGPEKDAIVVRSPEGLVTKVTERKFVKDKYPILGIPILRGAVTFISSMITGVKALMFSADYFPDDENAEPGKLDKWLDEHIPADKLPHIFDRFYRADEARTDGSSFGLGLAIAKAIVDAHRGVIRCESGGGVTRFIISLPLAAGKQERGTDHV